MFTRNKNISVHQIKVISTSTKEFNEMILKRSFQTLHKVYDFSKIMLTSKSH